MSRRRALLATVAFALTLAALPLTAGAQRSGIATVNVAFNQTLKEKILVTGEGMTLYLWLSDPPNKSTCYDNADLPCTQVWRPYRTTGPPVAGAGAKAELLSTLDRTDGDPQTTYNRHPLYTDVGGLSIVADVKPGDINGQDQFGWYAVSPSGNAIKRAAVSPSLKVRPTSVARGGKVTVSGRGCASQDIAYLISPPFSGHAFVQHSVATKTDLGGNFSKVVRIRTNAKPGRYLITARCGGGNLGVAAHLRVR